MPAHRDSHSQPGGEGSVLADLEALLLAGHRRRVLREPVGDPGDLGLDRLNALLQAAEALGERRGRPDGLDLILDLVDSVLDSL